MENNKKIPKHVGLILDGNRRWAKERNLPTFDGHKKGYEKFKLVPDWFFANGVEIVSAFIFSTENWNRSRDEVNYLMKLIESIIKNDTDEMHRKGYKILVSGKLTELPGDLSDMCLDLINKTKNNQNGILNICLNYGGRAEIVDAIKKMIKNKIEADQVHEGLVKKYLYQGEISDPDIIVRTSGEKRLSGFQLWESQYSELMFMEKYWPDFEEVDVRLILEEYDKRKRRFGGD